VRKLAVDTAGENFNVTLVKLSEFLLKCMELGRAHECEVQWVEEQNHAFFAAIVGELDFSEITIDNCICLEIRSLTTN
jgi:hypothetical protein